MQADGPPPSFPTPPTPPPPPPRQRGRQHMRTPLNRWRLAGQTAASVARPTISGSPVDIRSTRVDSVCAAGGWGGAAGIGNAGGDGEAATVGADNGASGGRDDAEGDAVGVAVVAAGLATAIVGVKVVVTGVGVGVRFVLGIVAERVCMGGVTGAGVVEVGARGNASSHRLHAIPRAAPPLHREPAVRGARAVSGQL